ncbi:MAG: S8 family serine peptidase [Tepidisphaeraceae bacterium]
MTKFTRSPSCRLAFEALEDRRLLAASDFGSAAAAIHFAEASAAFPSATGTGQTIAVIDSGIDYTHPSLGGGFGPGFKVVGGHDFVDNDDDPMDELGHGTEVAGVIAAKPASTSTGDQYQGIAPDAKLVALRVDDADFDTPVPDSKIEAALQWVIDHREEFGITIVNVSYGQGFYDSPTVSTVYGDEIVALRDAGVTIVASSGNGGVSSNQGINSPAADPSVISVGSVALDGTISTFSQRGSNLTLLAPGEEIQTTFLGGGYGLEEGTSFAAPIVAGVVALMRNIDSTLKPADVTSILRASGVATFDGGASGSNVTRLIYPRLDMLNALSLTNSRKPGTNLEQLAIGSLGNQSALATDCARRHALRLLQRPNPDDELRDAEHVRPMVGDPNRRFIAPVPRLLPVDGRRHARTARHRVL